MFFGSAAAATVRDKTGREGVGPPNGVVKRRGVGQKRERRGIEPQGVHKNAEIVARTASPDRASEIRGHSKALTAGGCVREGAEKASKARRDEERRRSRKIEGETKKKGKRVCVRAKKKKKTEREKKEGQVGS